MKMWTQRKLLLIMLVLALALGFLPAAAISDYARTAMGWAIENGIVNGDANGKLNPQGTASRAHVAAVMARYREKLA